MESHGYGDTAQAIAEKSFHEEARKQRAHRSQLVGNQHAMNAATLNTPRAHGALAEVCVRLDQLEESLARSVQRAEYLSGRIFSEPSIAPPPSDQSRPTEDHSLFGIISRLSRIESLAAALTSQIQGLEERL